RSDQAALLDQLRNDSQARKTQSVVVVPPAQGAAPAEGLTANAATKPAKSTPPVARKEPKPERTRAVETKPIAEQPLQIQPPAARCAGRRAAHCRPACCAARAERRATAAGSK